MLIAGFLLVLLFNTEDGYDTLLWNFTIQETSLLQFENTVIYYQNSQMFTNYKWKYNEYIFLTWCGDQLD
jgi:hypothetical protein